jgi:hypothetical protein
MRQPVKTVHVGLGPIGLEIVRAGVSAGLCEPVSAADINPDLAGADLADFAACDAPPVVIDGNLNEAASRGVEQGAQVAVVATGSHLGEIADQFEALLSAGLNCLSTCEELVFPWLRAADEADRLDAIARRHEVSLLGAGVNPGFVLDLLPFVMTRVCQEVQGVYAGRFVDASVRRRQLQAKIGCGLSEEQFRERAAEDAVGHVGLAESAALLADSMGWPWDDIEEAIDPVMAEQSVSSDYFSVTPGRVRGQAQTVQLSAPQGKVELELVMALGEDSRDMVRVEGEPPVNVMVEGGIHGDRATAGMVTNWLAPVVKAAPGLRSVTDVPLA